MTSRHAMGADCTQYTPASVLHLGQHTRPQDSITLDIERVPSSQPVTCDLKDCFKGTLWRWCTGLPHQEMQILVVPLQGHSSGCQAKPGGCQGLHHLVRGPSTQCHPWTAPTLAHMQWPSEADCPESLSQGCCMCSSDSSYEQRNLNTLRPARMPRVSDCSDCSSPRTYRLLLLGVEYP